MLPIHLRRARRGFTLTEVLIAMTLGSLALAAVAQMTIGVGRMNFDSVAKLIINNDVRGFTQQLSQAGRSAREYRVYASAQNLTERQSGQSGDLLVLIWADPVPLDDPAIGATQEYYYRRVIAFARTIDNATTNTGPVMRYEVDFPAGGSAGALRASSTTIQSITQGMLAGTTPNMRRREVLELTRGLANGRLFFNGSTGRSVVINGEIFHDNRAREVTNTYNFTITPRG